ncbi:hypothetical protein SKAU_G00203350 [Synaphobranchus kaupii]|uniref:Uncharacterized protein n=1 Tax=Synaphobranchus kaupii TaxID=118154 RepID=A0A9Q1FFV3_SYNKA|nr:hypothetical protein SKAU_G00203350 [Synaphobranchus kaupii]
MHGQTAAFQACHWEIIGAVSFSRSVTRLSRSPGRKGFPRGYESASSAQGRAQGGKMVFSLEMKITTAIGAVSGITGTLSPIRITLRAYLPGCRLSDG